MFAVKENFPEIVKRSQRLINEKYADAVAAFLCGSIIRGTHNADSDYDVVVIYPELENAYRESYMFENRKIETFVHDPETLTWFFEKCDAASGIPSLPTMVDQGLIIKNNEGLADKIKAQAHELLLLGPEPLSLEQIEDYRYRITDLCDDLRTSPDISCCLAAGTSLYQVIADFYLRVNDSWSAGGKMLPVVLKEHDPQFAYRYSEAFLLLFNSQLSYSVITLAEEILEPWGGFLFDGYKREAKPKMRLKRSGWKSRLRKRCKK
ncbi:MAG: nucleotidyltransferase domain-containing protein [Candidatus Rifleibacteriota bacterium]